MARLTRKKFEKRLLRLHARLAACPAGEAGVTPPGVPIERRRAATRLTVPDRQKERDQWPR